MAELSAEEIAQRLIDLNLVTDRDLRSVWGEFGRRNVSPEEFTQLLLRRELLTNYQLDRALRGERNGFFYGDYKVLYLVAAGSFARVYRAAHKETGRVVALKVLRRRWSDNPAHAEQFVREGEMGRTLRHPNIVPIYEVYSKGRTHFLVMEFVEGHNLRDFMRLRKKLDPLEATRLMIGITSGLNYAFQRGVAHRDLKLSNILISSRGQPKLVDFGLAAADERISDEALANHPNPRTIDYAGLERATGVRKDDMRSDIYFLGCIYYHMLTGQPPLQETKDRIQRLSKTRYLEVVPIHKLDPDIPRVVAAVVNQAMELDVDRRYQTPAQMLVDLNVAAKRVEAGQDIDELPDAEAQPTTNGDRDRWVSMLAAEGRQQALMVVEANTKMQDLLRDGLKRAGYRVLLTSDPNRAMQRFDDDQPPADAIIFSTGGVGKPAVEAFNRFGQEERTRQIPAVLLLDKRHRGWRDEADVAPHRVVVTMPIKLRQLRDVIRQLMPGESAEAQQR